MWLVPRMTSGKISRHVIPPEARAALVRWYTGEGSDADHRASMTLVTGARERHLWFACDCLGNDERPPLLSPAYLSEAETYYLRRLTSSHRLRPEHRDDCPFFREQSAPRLREKLRPEAREIDEIDQFFLAHRLAPEKLAQRPDEAEVDDRARGVAIPRLARLLWMLMDRASLNRIPFLPESGDEPPLDLGKGFALVKRHAEPFEVAPGVPLAPHLYTHVEPYERLQLHARLRQAARTWPDGFAPQAFMLLYTEDFSGSTLHLAQKHELEINTRIQYLGSKREEGPPYLALVLVGETNPKDGYRALRGFVQPVVATTRLFPIQRDSHRQIVKALAKWRFDLREMGIALGIERPLFDEITSAGPLRPDLVCHFHRPAQDQSARVALYFPGDAEDPRHQQAMDARTLMPTIVLQEGRNNPDQVRVAIKEALGM